MGIQDSYPAPAWPNSGKPATQHPSSWVWEKADTISAPVGKGEPNRRRRSERQNVTSQVFAIRSTRHRCSAPPQRFGGIDRGGIKAERTEWHNLVGYARGAEILRDYVKKGSKLYVEGRITTRSWDDKETGKKVYRTEIVVSEISLLSPAEVPVAMQ